MTDDDHRYFPIPYLLDEDQHPLARIQRLFIRKRKKNSFSIQPDVTFDDDHYNSFVLEQ